MVLRILNLNHSLDNRLNEKLMFVGHFNGGLSNFLNGRGDGVCDLNERRRTELSVVVVSIKY